MKVTGTTIPSAKKKRGVQGKIARKRQSANLLAKSLKAHGKSIAQSPSTENAALGSSSSKLANSKNIFAGLNINVSDLTKTLLPHTVPVTKDSVPKHFPKKEKRKLRHAAFLKKIELVNAVRQEKKKKEKRPRKSDNEDVESEVPLAVPETTSVSTEDKQPDKKKKKKTENVRKKPISKAKDRRHEELQDIQLFKEVMSNAVYQKNPEAAITNFVRRKVRESILQSES